MEFWDELDASRRPDSDEAWDARNRNGMLVKIETALLPQNVATALPDIGLKRENGEWVTTWESGSQKVQHLFGGFNH